MMTTQKDIEDFVEKNQSICDAGRPASDELIDRAERFLDVRFPEDYRAFLRRWGTLAIGPLEFYGICNEDFVNSSVPNAIWYTQQLRQQVGLPKALVILYDNNGDEYYCLDTSVSENSRIVAWDTHQRKVRVIKAESLFEFILNESADSV